MFQLITNHHHDFLKEGHHVHQLPGEGQLLSQDWSVHVDSFES